MNAGPVPRMRALARKLSLTFSSSAASLDVRRRSCLLLSLLFIGSSVVTAIPRHGHGDTSDPGGGHTKEFIRIWSNSFVRGVSAASGCSRSAWRRLRDRGPRLLVEHPLGLED